jgi:hypothetical protein
MVQNKEEGRTWRRREDKKEVDKNKEIENGN